MEVWEHGNKYNTHHTCKECNCRFIYDSFDIKYQYYHTSQGDPDFIQILGFVKCPECGIQINVIETIERISPSISYECEIRKNG